ncbi:peptidoglycan-binding protein [Streptomyces sp. NPDC058755]|uniref:peptidoglycan-binding domain-containing protein n=1 Tax=Streptomyces sp. NPDC058755 TaxID=3346624 RepID=UPI00368725A0
MTEPTGHTCPECGAPRGADNTPSCDCTQRASDALREARTAQAAAAEDFNPLRIRPYVEVAGADAGAGAGASDEGSAAQTHPVPAVEATLPLRPMPGASTADLSLFEQEPPDEPEVSPADDAPPRRSRRTVLLSVAGAAIAVVAAAGMASGLFSYHPPARDRAAQEVRPSVPDTTTPGTSSAPAAPVSPRPASPPASPSLDPTPTPTATSASPTPTSTRSHSPSPSASPTPSATTRGTPNAAPTGSVPVLQRGDKGPEVTELQLRLQQLNLYDDEVNGVFARPVEDAVRTYQWARGLTDDPLGVYGPTTRESLESETTKP